MTVFDVDVCHNIFIDQSDEPRSPSKVKFFAYIFIPSLFNPVVGYRKQFSIWRLVCDLSAGGLHVTVRRKSEYRICKSSRTRR